jgi:hypothetical protein
VRILLWSGDTAPGADALKIAEDAGLLNMNGGDTSITRSNPSLTAVGAHGIQKNGFLQVYAPITNENIYTNLWRGPYYGFERVIESFEMTESPPPKAGRHLLSHLLGQQACRPECLAQSLCLGEERSPCIRYLRRNTCVKVRDFHDMSNCPRWQRLAHPRQWRLANTAPGR